MGSQLSGMVLAVSTIRSIGLVIMALVLIGFVVYVIANVRAGRQEVGAEIELAPNRKPYLDDEALEGRKLERALGWGLVTLAVVGLGLPLYWLNEPGRQDGAKVDFERVFADRGGKLFATTAEGGYNCAGCHGPAGVGGSYPYTITNDNGDFIAQVKWQAPALNTVLLRYSKAEVTYILTYGRPFSPMPAWGIAGGGPLNSQQIDNLVDYLQSIQLSSDASKKAAAEELAKAMKLVDANGQALYKSEGQALFNLGRDDGFAGGAYACGRCHTQGWSYYADPAAPAGTKTVPDGSGALGPNLTGGDTLRQFPAVGTGPKSIKAMLDFITLGSEDGKKYGVHGQGTGKMPGFGDNPDDKDDPNDDKPNDGMLTPEMIQMIVAYERSL